MEHSATLIDLFTTLFVISITVIGIAIAGIIALTQVLQPLLTFKSTQRIIRNGIFKVTSFLLICLTAATLLPMFLLSMEEHDYIQGFNLHINEVFASQWYVLFVILLLITSFVLVILVIYQETQYLVPANALKFLKANSNSEAIKHYFEVKYANPPSPIINFAPMFEIIRATGSKNKAVEEVVDDKKIQDEYAAGLREYEKKKKLARKLENPLLPLESYITQSIRRNDLQTTIDALHVLEETIIQLSNSKDFNKLDRLVEYYRVVIENGVELAGSLGLQSFIHELIESTSRLSNELIVSRQFSAINQVLEFWQAQADESIGVHPTNFKMIVANIRECGETIVRDKKIKWKDCEDLLDNISRTLGWLGERMLSKGEPEKKAIMNLEYQSEFDALMNAVTGIGWGFHSDRPKAYPLIFFDSLYVIARKLAPYVHADPERNDLSDSLFSLMYELDSFATSAIRAGNVSGASLAILRLKEHIEIAEKNSLEEQKRYVLESIFRVGAYAASYGMVKIADFLTGKDMTDAVLAIIQKHIGTHNLDHEAREVLIKFDYYKDHKAAMDYLRAAGSVLGTNFGLNLKP